MTPERLAECKKYLRESGNEFVRDLLIALREAHQRQHARNRRPPAALLDEETVREKAAQLVENYESDAFGQIRPKDKLLAGQHLSGIAAAIRQQVKTP